MSLMPKQQKRPANSFPKKKPQNKTNTVKGMGNKLKWLVHLCAQIYDASMRCCWQILLVKPSSRNKQGLSQSLSYSSSLVLQKENVRPMDPG